MKPHTIAGLLAVASGLALVALWVYFISYVITQSPPGMSNIVDEVGKFLAGGANWEFFVSSTLCALAGFLSGFLFLSGKYPKLALTIVAANSVAVSFMYAWFLVALVASPLLMCFQVLRQHNPQLRKPGTFQKAGSAASEQAGGRLQ